MTYDPTPASGQVWKRAKDDVLVVLQRVDLNSGRQWIDWVHWETLDGKRKGDCYVASLLKNYTLTTI